MALETWLAFVLAASILLVIPGPTILTVISYSLVHGRGANGPLVVAVAFGDSTALLLSLVGLGALLATSAFLFTLIKWAGGLYLIVLGVKLFRSGVRVPEATTQTAGTSMARLFFSMYLVTALNPKGIIFFIAFLPQFLHTERPIAAQLWTLSITFVVLAAINASLYAVFAASARRLLSSAKAQRRFNFVGGGLLTGAGVWALLARRAS